MPLLALVAFLCPSVDTLRDLELLSKTKQFFELRDRVQKLEDKSVEALYFRAEVEEKFNRLAAANTKFSEYLTAGGKRQAETHTSMGANYARLGEYLKAERAYRSALGAGVSDRGDIENVAKLWGALKDVPSQIVQFGGDSDISISKSFHVQVEANGQSLPFIFDTGANITTVSETYATKLALRLIDTTIMVGGITAALTPARLGVASEIRLGKATVKNAVFLVFRDKDLYIRSANMQLHGILGFPVISAMREITLTRDGRLLIPATPKARGLENLALDGLTPCVLAKFGEARLTCALDTGANESMLYPPFLRRFESEVSKFDSITHRFAGVGSARTVPAKAGRDLKLSVGGQEVVFPRIPILTHETTADSGFLFGNLGQDMVGQFDSMTMNFEKMSLEFGPRAPRSAGHERTNPISEFKAFFHPDIR